MAALHEYPASWLVRVERAPPEWDMRGADVRVVVRYRCGDLVVLPLQVRSTEAGRQQFVANHRKASDIPALTVGLRDNNVHICLRAYALLAQLRVQNHRCNLLEYLSTPPEGVGKEVVQKIRANRRLNPVNPHQLNDWSFWERAYLWWMYQ